MYKMPNLKTMADAWEFFVKSFDRVLPPDQLAMYQRAFYAGALSHDVMIDREVKDRPMTDPECERAAALVVRLHEELQEFARNQIKMHTPNPNN